MAFAGSAESARSVIDIWERVRVTAIPAAGFGGLSQKPLQDGQWGGNLRRKSRTMALLTDAVFR